MPVLRRDNQRSNGEGKGMVMPEKLTTEQIAAISGRRSSLMRIIYGDFWDLAKKLNIDVLCVTTNNIVKNNGELVMGAGIAKQFRDRFPELARHFGEILERGENPQNLPNLSPNPFPDPFPC